MKYTLDQVAENLIHALCEAVLLRRRASEDAQSIEAAIAKDVIHDLATGLGLYFNLPAEGETPGSLHHFVRAIHFCTSTDEVMRVFQGIPALSGYLMPPYFSKADLRLLEQ